MAEGELRRWRIGPSVFWLERQAREWRIYQAPADDGAEQALELATRVDAGDLPSAATANRFSFSRPPTPLTLRPLLADRAVVIRPESPFFVPPGETVTLFVSTPLWVHFGVGAPEVKLLDAPIQRPSDTWFGPSTLEGELCYASRTAARLDLVGLSARPHRATTPVRIRNQAVDALLLERIRVPVRYLTLYQGERGFLWTEPLTLTREADGDLAGLELGRRPAREAGRTTAVSEPREHAERNLAVRAFSRIFGGHKEG